MKIIEVAKQVIKTEIEGLEFMSSRLDINFANAVQAILNTSGRTIICGMGKSGIIGKKIAASFASTGTPSFFMHPGEAFHGDLGMVKPEDIFIAISNSGETDEVLKLLPFLKDNKNFVIAMTGNNESTLAKNSQCHLDINVPREACHLQLAPTSSTTAALVMGDALTVVLMEEISFKSENFARFHPGGSLGRRLLSRVEDEMETNNLPFIKPDACFKDIIHIITEGKLGLAIILSEDNRVGIITDGDLRRAMECYGKSVFDIKAIDIATFSPASIEADTKTATAIEKMDLLNISSFLVTKNSQVVGVLKK